MNIALKQSQSKRNLKALPWLIAAVLLAPAIASGQEEAGVKHRMVAFLNTTTPLGLGPNNQTGINLQALVDSNGDSIRWLTLGNAHVPLWAQDIFTPGFTPDPATDLVPVLAPDGHHLTPSEWWRAQGKAQVTCLPQGTRYQFKFRGLVPDGVYTIWHFTPTGGGALASHLPDDVNNVFMASDTGAADFSVVGTPGPATLGGFRPACTLTQSEEFFVVLYHIDGKYCGPFPCDSPLVPVEDRPEEIPSEVAHLFFRR